MHRTPQASQEPRLQELTQNQLASVREAWLQQVKTLENERVGLRQEFEIKKAQGVLDRGLEIRLSALDARLAAGHGQIANVDAELARRVGQSAEREARFAETRAPDFPPPPQPSFPEALIAIPMMFILCVGLPLSIAYARRIWRRAGDIGNHLPQEILDRLHRMDQNIDAIALEVERIGESQRFVAKQQAEHLGIAAGGAERVEANRIGERERSR